MKADTKAIQAIHEHVITHNPRVTVSHSDLNTWNLHIKAVTEDDRGGYMCQLNTDPMKSTVRSKINLHISQSNLITSKICHAITTRWLQWQFISLCICKIMVSISNIQQGGWSHCGNANYETLMIGNRCFICEPNLREI